MYFELCLCLIDLYLLFCGFVGVVIEWYWVSELFDVSVDD